MDNQPTFRETELRVLRALASDTPTFSLARDIKLTSQHFPATRHMRLFDALGSLHAKSWPVDVETLGSTLGDLGINYDEARKVAENFLAQPSTDTTFDKSLRLLMDAHDKRVLRDAFDDVRRLPFDRLTPETVLLKTDKLAAAAHLASGREGTPLDVLNVDDVLDLPDRSWLIPGAIASQETVMLYGASGIGKSFLALDWALSLSSGTPWAGEDIPAARPVLYFAGESPAGYGPRLRAWQQRRGPIARDLFHMVPNTINLSERQTLQSVRSTVNGLPKRPALLVFDTLARCWSGDENSAQDVGVINEAFEQLRRSLNVSILVVHHTGRKTGDERGSTALRGYFDSMLLMRRSAGGRVDLTASKSRNGRPTAKRRFEGSLGIDVVSVTVKWPSRAGAVGGA